MIFRKVPKKKWPVSEYATSVERVYQSDEYFVQVHKKAVGVRWVAVSRIDCEDRISWDELQHIKSVIGFPDRMAVEIYPKDADIVNVANMRHLWVLDEPLPIGWTRGDDRRREDAEEEEGSL